MPIKLLDGRMLDSSGKLVINECLATSITGTNSTFTNITGTNFYLDGLLTVSDASSVIGLSSKVVTNEYITNTYSVTSLNVNGDINTTGAMYGGVGITTINGTSYTVSLSDNGGIIASTNNTTGLTASVVGTSYPRGFQVAFMQLSGSATTGRITISGQNIPINQTNGYNKTSKQYSSATLINFGAPAGWVLFGDVSA